MADHSDFVDLLKSGDQQAFAELVTRYQQPVYNTIVSIIQHAQDAEDLAQEVFVQVYRSLAGFRGEAKISTWIYRIAVTKSLEWERKKKAKKAIGYFKNLVGLENPSDHPTEFHHPGVALVNKENASMLFQAMQILPENQRIAFVLIKAEGLSYQEAGLIMGKSVKSIEGLIQRAKENLQQTLKKHYLS